MLYQLMGLIRPHTDIAWLAVVYLEQLEPKWFLVAKYENQCGGAIIFRDREVYLTMASYPNPNAGYSPSMIMCTTTHPRNIEWWETLSQE